MQSRTIAGVRADVVGDESARGVPVVVLLHGYDGFAGDLSPFARSFGLPFTFVFPEAPWKAAPGGRSGNAWWSIDDEGRAAALALGAARDLSELHPAGLPAARDVLVRVLDEVERTFAPSKLVIGGFSQGAMLTCDLALTTERPLRGLVLLSGARIRRDVWARHHAGRRGLDVFSSHGMADPDLAFATAEALRDDFRSAGNPVTWVAFEGGHEVPLIALRGLKRFLATLGSKP